MTRRIRKLFTLFLLLGFITQPLLAQAFAVQDALSPCPTQQADHHAVSQHDECASHADKVCIDCDLCGHTNSGVLSGPLFLNGLRGSSEPAEVLRSAFVSVYLSVDSPPPRIL